MRYIRNISDDQNKSGDTDNIFRFNLLQGDDIFNFGDYPISINIANSSGYILSMVPEKEFGNSVLKLDFNDQSLKSLTPDNYLLEVEVKFPDGTTATFPTKGGMPFTVNSNLKSTTGHLVPTVTFDEVLDAVDKKVNNYLATVAKGDKGDTGVVDTTADYTWTGTNTFNQKIIVPAGVRGNADTTTKLQTTRNINGVGFDGTSDITIDPVTHTISSPVDILTLSNGFYYNAGADSTNRPSSSFYFTFEIFQTSSNGFIRAIDHTGNSFWATKSGNNWGVWRQDADDSKVVHNAGNETVAGDKTFTGNNTFTDLATFSKPIQGSLGVRSYPFTTIANLSGKLLENSGKWGITSDRVTDLPQGGYAILTVYPYIDNGSSGFATLQYTSGDFYFSEIIGANIVWKKVAKDSEVIHNTGTETIAGDKTFTGSTDIRNQKQYKASFSIGTNTINLTRIGSMVYVNGRLQELTEHCELLKNLSW